MRHRKSVQLLSLLGFVSVFALLLTNVYIPAAFAAPAQHTQPATIIHYPPAQITPAPTSCTASGYTWTYNFDVEGYQELDVPSGGSRNCVSIEWNYGSLLTNTYIWVPSSYADASICFGFYSVNTRVGVGCVEESQYTDQWAKVVRTSGVISNDGINNIRMSNNNGENGTYIGLGCYPGIVGLASSSGGAPPKLPKSASWQGCP